MDPPRMMDAVLSTAPASPTGEVLSQSTVSDSTSSSNNMLPPQHSTMASLSFGPATQQTVTTVTTTTTVSLPPLIMRPPKDLYDRDPKQYPLAFSPTPHTIKRFCFDVNGRPTVFHESEDPEETARRYHELQAKIHRHHGSIRHEDKQEGYQTPYGELLPPLGKSIHNVRASSAPKRTATPPSIAEAAELASLQRKTKKQRSHLHRTYSDQVEEPSINDRIAATSLPAPNQHSPVTPDVQFKLTALKAAAHQHAGSRKRTANRPSHSRIRELQDDREDVDMADSELPESDSQLGPPLYSHRQGKKSSHGDGVGAIGAIGAVATPPIAETDREPLVRDHEPRRPTLPNILTGSHQDASLPSPSLSPITAAANLASRQNAFDHSFAEHNEENKSNISGMDLEDDTSKTQSARSFDSQSSRRSGKAPLNFAHEAQRSQGSANTPTVMDIPTMVEAFDSMPEAMQTYLVYQFLRRCAKPTLQMVANAVNPALKCDPFSVLPPELGLNITRFLDAQSMCRAAQVSKRWRKNINSDEKAWKDLLKRDDFALPSGEIARAVREGWGWQHPGEFGYEEDLSKRPLSCPSDTGNDTIVSDDELTTSSSLTTRGTKRKSVVKSSSSKKSKRRPAHASSAITKPTAPTNSKWLELLGTAKGAIAFATAAAHAVPHPGNGLESLRNMHLFKSLYQRHFLIRKAWMTEESQPQHLAFRAHHRHVVTCLLFDGDKILTGSDDTKINVYDTKTGALRNRLEGHEGGVWALQYEGDTLVSGSTDRSVRVWDIRSGKCLQTFQGHTSTVRCLVILKPVQIDTEPDGTPVMMPKEPLIITGSRDSTLRVWRLPQPGDRQIFQAGPPANDRDNPYFLRTLSGHHNSVRAIAAHGDTLISGSYDCTVRVWKISTGDLVHRLQGHSQKVYSVVLDHARGRCISGSMDNLVKVWDLASGACLFTLEGHTSLVGLLDLSHDRLVSAAADSTLRIWDPENGTCKSTLSAHTGAITCFQHDGQKVISGSDRTLKMWNVKTGECVRDLLTDLSGVWQVRFDERRCVAAVQRNSLTYIEVLDFGASRDGVPDYQRGRRVVVDCRGNEIEDVDTSSIDQDAAAVA